MKIRQRISKLRPRTTPYQRAVETIDKAIECDAENKNTLETVLILNTEFTRQKKFEKIRQHKLRMQRNPNSIQQDEQEDHDASVIETQRPSILKREDKHKNKNSQKKVVFVLDDSDQEKPFPKRNDLVSANKQDCEKDVFNEPLSRDLLNRMFSCDEQITIQTPLW